MQELNSEYIERNVVLEEENRQLPSLRSQIEQYRTEQDVLQTKISHLTAQYDGRTQELSNVREQLEQIQKSEFDARSDLHTVKLKLQMLEEQKSAWEMQVEASLQEVFTPELYVARMVQWIRTHVFAAKTKCTDWKWKTKCSVANTPTIPLPKLPT